MVKWKRIPTLERIEGAKLMKNIFGSKLLDEDFRQWLANKLDIDESLVSLFLAQADDDYDSEKKKGRPMLSKELRQDVYDF